MIIKDIKQIITPHVAHYEQTGVSPLTMLLWLSEFYWRHLPPEYHFKWPHKMLCE